MLSKAVLLTVILLGVVLRQVLFITLQELWVIASPGDGARGADETHRLLTCQRSRARGQSLVGKRSATSPRATKSPQLTLASRLECPIISSSFTLQSTPIHSLTRWWVEPHLLGLRHAELP